MKNTPLRSWLDFPLRPTKPERAVIRALEGMDLSDADETFVNLPLDRLRAMQNQPLRFRQHVLDRMGQRGVSMSDILACLAFGKHRKQPGQNAQIRLCQHNGVVVAYRVHRAKYLNTVWRED